MRKKSQKVAGWGNYPMVDAQVTSPKDAAAWQASGHQHPRVVRGLGRSYGDQSIDLEATIADTRRLNHLLSFDDETGVLVCQAGVSLADIIATLAPRGWFPVVNPGTKYVTVGGAIANDIHGKGHHRDGSFARYVRSFTMLLASGDV